MIFSVGLLTFAVVMALVAGPWQSKAGPRLVATTGGLVLGLGYVLAGLSGTSFWGILLGVGLLGGAGIGLGYVCPIAALVKWFPDKKGMITGLAVAGFGFGALIWIKLTSGFKFGPIDLTPGWGGLYGMGWSVSRVHPLRCPVGGARRARGPGDEEPSRRLDSGGMDPSLLRRGGTVGRRELRGRVDGIRVHPCSKGLPPRSGKPDKR